MLMRGETYMQRQIRLKRERGQRMAKARWAGVKARQRAEQSAIERDPLRAALMLAPLRRLRQRVIVIGPDQVARELVRWTDTTARQWAAMKRAAGL